MVGRRIGRPVPGDGLLGDVVVGTVAVVQGTVPLGPGGVPQVRQYQGQVVVGGGVLRVQGQGLLEPLPGPSEEFGAGLATGLAPLDPSAFVEGTAQFGQHPVVGAKVEAPLPGIREPGLRQGLQVSDSPVQVTQFPFDQGRVPGAHPGRRGRVHAGCPIQGLGGGVEFPLTEVDARQVEWPIGPPQALHLGKGGRGLAQPALLAGLAGLPQQADAVVVPALPLRGDGAVLGRGLWGAGQGQDQRIRRQGGDG